MIDITIGGVCVACNRYSPGLFTCANCRARVCPLCVIPKTRFCVICKGKKMKK